MDHADIDIPNVLYVRKPRTTPVPLVFDSPHSGTHYPDDFRPAAPLGNIRQVEDTLVDALFADAPDHGAPLLAARFGRMYIDPNRAETDLDPTTLEGVWPGPPLVPGSKGLHGKGLIFMRCPPGIKIYDRHLSAEEIWNRIVTYHRPYHAHLQQLLDQTHAKFGRVYHINCHCMASRPNPASGEPFRDRRPDFILGNMDGQSSGPELVEVVRQFLAGCGYDVRVNEWFKGVEVARLYGRPADQRHTLQIEINRDLYCDEETLTAHSGFDQFKVKIRELLSILQRFSQSASS